MMVVLFMKKIKLILLAAQIEWQWWLIRKERKKGRSLLSKGYALSSCEMLKQNSVLSKRSAKLIVAQRAYSQILGKAPLTTKTM
jgi:hypothetical protein